MVNNGDFLEATRRELTEEELQGLTSYRARADRGSVSFPSFLSWRVSGLGELAAGDRARCFRLSRTGGRDSWALPEFLVLPVRLDGTTLPRIYQISNLLAP